VGLNGGADPNNREPFPWHDEKSWNHKLLEYTSELMNIKKTNKILKYGSFELIDHDYELIIFRRKLKGESLICIFNKFDKVENISLKSIAHKISQIYGINAMQLIDNSIEIEVIEKYSGLIIHEQ
jgi:glycosidase